MNNTKSTAVSLADLPRQILDGPYRRLPGKTVFLLGAGFSASMGIPVMKGFLSKECLNKAA